MAYCKTIFIFTLTEAEYERSSLYMHAVSTSLWGNMIMLIKKVVSSSFHLFIVLSPLSYQNEPIPTGS